MEFEKLSNLSLEQQKEILSDLIQNDVSYWKKAIILMAMVDENEDTELLDLIIEHKIEEINLANKKYNLSLKYQNIKDNTKTGYVTIIEKLVSGINDAKYSMACKEVLEVLKFIPFEYYEKINKKFIERLEQNADSSHSLLITRETKYDDLVLLKETQDILSLVCSKFWNTAEKTIDIKEIFNK